MQEKYPVLILCIFAKTLQNSLAPSLAGSVNSHRPTLCEYIWFHSKHSYSELGHPEQQVRVRWLLELIAENKR